MIEHSPQFWLGVLVAEFGGLMSLAGFLDARMRPFVLGAVIFGLGVCIARDETAPKTCETTRAKCGVIALGARE